MRRAKLETKRVDIFGGRKPGAKIAQLRSVRRKSMHWALQLVVRLRGNRRSAATEPGGSPGRKLIYLERLRAIILIAAFLAGSTEHPAYAQSSPDLSAGEAAERNTDDATRAVIRS